MSKNALRTLPMFSSAHLYAGHKSALVPAKQRPRSAQRKELDDL